ncbi:hypothetical protein [Sphingomonas lenta]|uniref:Uncharacterized protein n=1 Tax=Sphingomonas lenta TaxID=1141887 RepID=A0A2A2SGS7_9SPHN|nr:hypothetical protein [Sphingomonas lenta]PAX08456.1 hypothetical protein CKY28_03440 [Sphingomonas lenta]
MMAKLKRTAPLALLLTAAACGGGEDDRRTEANSVAEDPFGATGAPGADMTDNGVNDGASGPADNAAESVANGS